MTKSNIYLTGAAALVALAAVASIGFITHAQSEATSTPEWFGRHMRQNLTDEQKAELQDKIGQFKATADANRQKIIDAMAQGYDAWVQAVKDIQGDTAPILSKINAGNFSQYAQAYNYMSQARQIYTNLGLDQGEFGFGRHGGMMGKGMMGGWGGFWNKTAPASGATTSGTSGT